MGIFGKDDKRTPVKTVRKAGTPTASGFGNVKSGTSTSKAGQSGAAGARPSFGNVSGGGSSTAPSTSPSSLPAEALAVEIYEVKGGDSLWKIAKRFYGKGTLWTRIHEANRDVISDPDVIHPGQKLRIPKL